MTLLLVRHGLTRSPDGMNIDAAPLRPSPLRIAGETPQPGSQSGFILLTVVIVIAVGSILILGLLSYTSAALRAGADDIDSLAALYAAESGIAVVVAKLQSNDNLDGCCPAENVGGFSVHLAVSGPSGDSPPGVHQYLDPGEGDGFGALGPGQSHTFTIQNVKAGEALVINWPISSQDPDWAINIHKGPTTAATLELPTRVYRVDGVTELPTDSVSDGTYTIEFTNRSATTTIASAPFTPSGDRSDTWVYVQSHQDYVVTSTANSQDGEPQATVTAYLRRMPDPSSPSRYRVYTLSWRPY